MNKTCLGLLIVLMYASIICFFVFAVIFATETHSNECLDSFAEEYCSENNMTFSSQYQDYFNCKNSNERFGELDKTKFYFLSSEREECLIKEKWTFKRLPEGVQD